MCNQIITNKYNWNTETIIEMEAQSYFMGLAHAELIPFNWCLNKH